MNMSVLFNLCIMTQGLCMIYCLFYFKMFPPVRSFTKSESWPVVGFSPRVTSTGVFMENPDTLYPNFWSFKEVFSATNKAIGLYGFTTLA